MAPTVRQSRANALATTHFATLAQAAATTDFPCTLELIEQLRAKVRRYRRLGDAGMLGVNGVAPEVDDAVKQAAFHGLGWAGARELAA